MANQFIRVPLRRLSRHHCDVYRIDFSLDICGQSGRFCRVPFRIDTGSDFTTVPISIATSLNIPFAMNRPVYPQTAAGKAQNPSFLSPIRLSFPGLPQWQFESMAMFTPYTLKTSLLSLAELVPNFLIRSQAASQVDPDGCVILQLRRDHQGTRTGRGPS